MPLFYLSLKISLIAAFVLLAIAVVLYIVQRHVVEDRKKQFSNMLCWVLAIQIAAAMYVFGFCVVSIFQLVI